MELYRRFHAESQRAIVKIFLYSGHEIPEFGGAGYDASVPDRTFTVRDLQSGLQGFTGSSAKFDLLVLSTCFGGTPYTIGALGPYARYIIASPDNLHLSYFDFRALTGSTAVCGLIVSLHSRKGSHASHSISSPGVFKHRSPLQYTTLTVRSGLFGPFAQHTIKR